ncbi:hypothetical protein AB0395_39025 [Streptosporangium sp. NPDC051023]|uniref:hypothetical protein n=1 Tax=Streptosporangium sp. NPDC051023 TaxID=3155410 RepID=UPI00344E23D6
MGVVSGTVSSMGVVSGMGVAAVHTGFQPLATCHWQGVANILEAQGLAGADRKVCPSWGFSWDGNSTVLRRGDRWIETLNATHELDVRRMDFATWDEAEAAELSIAERKLAFVAEIDAFEVHSEYAGREHVAHTVVVLDRRPDAATILDTMNRPEPVVVSGEHYRRMRTHPCVEAHHLYVSSHPPRREATLEEIAATFARSLGRHWADDLARFDAYRAWLGENGEMADVTRVGGERLYLAGLFTLLGELDEAFGDAAPSFLSLSRRWYLTHGLAISAVPVAGGRSREARVRRLLTDLRARETELHGRVWPVLERYAATTTTRHRR